MKAEHQSRGSTKVSVCSSIYLKVFARSSMISPSGFFYIRNYLQAELYSCYSIFWTLGRSVAGEQEKYSDQCPNLLFSQLRSYRRSPSQLYQCFSTSAIFFYGRQVWAIRFFPVLLSPFPPPFSYAILSFFVLSRKAISQFAPCKPPLRTLS